MSGFIHETKGEVAQPAVWRQESSCGIWALHINDASFDCLHGALHFDKLMLYGVLGAAFNMGHSDGRHLSRNIWWSVHILFGKECKWILTLQPKLTVKRSRMGVVAQAFTSSTGEMGTMDDLVRAL